MLEAINENLVKYAKRQQTSIKFNMLEKFWNNQRLRIYKLRKNTKRFYSNTNHKNTNHKNANHKNKNKKELSKLLWGEKIC